MCLPRRWITVIPNPQRFKHLLIPVEPVLLPYMQQVNKLAVGSPLMKSECIRLRHLVNMTTSNWAALWTAHARRVRPLQKTPCSRTSIGCVISSSSSEIRVNHLREVDVSNSQHLAKIRTTP